MPRSGQIIPEWLHPHEAVYINDNTRYEDIAFRNNGPTFLNVFMSPKGVDNKLKYFDSVYDWVKEYGLPNYRKYGQPAYNAYVSLSTGLANSQSMRVMPTNANYANLILLAHYKEEDGKLHLKFETKTVVNLTQIQDLQAYVDREASDIPDEEGYKVLPIASFWSRGRGFYANDYRVRISHDKGADKDNDYVNYAIELLTTENGSLETLETYTVSFYRDAIDPNSSFTLCVNDVIDDEEGKGSKRFNCAFEYDNLEKIFKVYEDVYHEAEEASHPELVPVDELPALNPPDANKLFVKGDEVEVYSETTMTMANFEPAPDVVEVAAMPIVAPTVDLNKNKENYLVNILQDKVYSYDFIDGSLLTNGRIHIVNDESELTSLILGHVYKITNSTDPARPNGYYVAVNTGTAEEPVVVLKGEADGVHVVEYPQELEDGTVFAITKLMYKVADGAYYGYLADAADAELTNVTARVEVVDEWPSTDVADPKVVYVLPDQTMWQVKAIDGPRVWVEIDEIDELEPMVYTMETWDIFGYNKFTGEMDPYFAFDGGTEAIEILSIEGCGFESGHDGSFSDVGTVLPNGETLTDAARDAAIEQAYLAAFQGGYDKAIASKRRAPVDIMLDACYPLSVKKAMVALALNRYDAACHLDTNLINNVSDLETFYTQISDLSERIVSFDAHMFRTTDPITGKVIPVTITLWLASKIPQHDNVYGNHTPLAGEEYATLSGYQKNSIRPIIDADDEETKELLYDKLHMNYIECIAENTYMRGTQQTSQNFWSDLSEENNMRVLLEIKRKIERLAAKNRYKWADTEELRLFKQDCQEIFSSYQGTKCKTLDIEVSSNDWEKIRYIVHVYLAVVFRTFQKRAIIEIDVNPRA